MARRATPRQSHKGKDSSHNERSLSTRTEVPHPADDGGWESSGIRHSIFKVQLQSDHRQPRTGLPHDTRTERPIPHINISRRRHRAAYQRSPRAEVDDLDYE